MFRPTFLGGESEQMTDEEIGFREEFHLGIPQIDGEHRRLFSLFHQLVVNQNRRTSSGSFSDVLTQISAELGQHFRSEEDYMRRAGLPVAVIDAHYEAHTEILRQLTTLHLSLTQGEVADYEQTLQMIARWVVEHLTCFDLHLRGCTV